MKALVVTDESGEGEVVVLEMFMVTGYREHIRAELKQHFGSRWVWFEDEVGTKLDPIRGPNPLFGPKKKK